MVVEKQITKDAKDCVKPILEILEQVESMLSTPSTAHDRSKEIESQMAKLSDATDESRKRYELKCEYLSQLKQSRLSRVCLSIIDEWNMNPNKLDAWVKVSYDYHFFQRELKEFKSIFREEFSMPSDRILTFSTATNLQNPKVQEALKNLYSCLVSLGELNEKDTPFNRFRSLFAGREIEKIIWTGDRGSCVEFISTLSRSGKLTIPKTQEKYEILTRFFECKGKPFTEKNFSHNKFNPKKYAPIVPFIDEFLDALS